MKKYTLLEIGPRSRKQLRNFDVVFMKYASWNIHVPQHDEIRNKIHPLIRRGERGDENPLKFRKI